MIHGRLLQWCRLIAIAGFVLLITGCGHGPAESSKSETPKADPGGEKPDAVLTTTELNDQFKKDTQAFLQKYQNKLLEITAKVTDYGHEFAGEGYLQLEGPGIFKIHCKEPQPWSKAMPGQTITVRGKCDPYAGIQEWAIVKVTGSPPPTYPADQLAKEFSTDEEGTKKKLKGKFLIVTGHIVKIEDEGSKVYLTDPEKKPAILCRFSIASAPETARNKAFKVGQQVKLLGQSLSGEPEIVLCESIDSP
jgi:hypothetical protein